MTTAVSNASMQRRIMPSPRISIERTANKARQAAQIPSTGEGVRDDGTGMYPVPAGL